MENRFTDKSNTPTLVSGFSNMGLGVVGRETSFNGKKNLFLAMFHV